MNFIRFFVERPVTALMIYLVLALGGVLSFFRMPVELMPGGESNVLSVMVGIRGGLPPEDVENLIIKPIEDEMATMANLEEINAVARKERATISLTFKVGTDTSRSELDVQERLSKIKGRLPREIERPVVSRYDESQAPIMILALSSKKYTPEQMREVADNQLKPQLKRIDGVANIEIGGGRERKILVEFDKTRLEAYRLPIRQVISQIGSENINALSGKAENERESYLIRTVGAFKTVEDIADLPIQVTKEGSRIRLRDVADIRDFYLEPESHSRMNRDPVVSLYVQKEALANTIVTAKNIRKAADEFKKTLDPAINFTVVSDQSIVIQHALNNVWNELIHGGVLAGLVLLFMLRDFLSAAYIFVAIPLSTLITLLAMRLFNLNLNVMTISALAISVGMVVDGAIVVLTNIMHHREAARQQAAGAQGLTQKELPVRATADIFTALLASTLTSVSVFLPIVFLNPQVRQLYAGLSITCVASHVISLIVGISVIPCLIANVPERWMKQSAYYSTYFWIYLDKRLARWRHKASALWLKFSLWIRKRYRRIRKIQADDDLVHPTQSAPRAGGRMSYRAYRRWVAFIMRKRYWAAGVLFLLLFGCSIMYKHMDKEFVGNTEENEFTIFVELPSGTKLEISDKVVGEVERILNETPEVKKSVKTEVSRVEGWSSKIYVTLVPTAERSRSVQEVIHDIRPLLAQVGREYDGFVYFSEPTSSKEFLIDVYGFDYAKIRDLAVQIAQRMEKVPGLSDIKLRYKPGRPELRILLDRQRAALVGFSVHDVAETLHAQVRGLRATYFMTPTAQVETVARLKEEYRKTLEDVENLDLINGQGNIVPLRQFSDFKFDLTPSEIYRKDRERMIQVSANRGDVSLSKVGELCLSGLQGVKVPTGYYYEIGGDYPKLLEIEKEFNFAFILMILLIYAVLASTFESYSQPVIILLAVPLTLIGAIPLLFATKTPITLGALIGFIMLGGIAVNNSILLVDVYNAIRKEKRNLRALLEAGQQRIKPILSTTLTNVLGMLPMILQKQESGSLWTPLAMTVTGGLIGSTTLILLILPGFYLILDDATAWCRKKIVRLQSFLADGPFHLPVKSR